ncbi:hypothetical protein V5O48_014088 [Marasmius crinis-equi]|uniref:Uncharacterized protein n=1 Tax=Marasmius crinis-equi TaxID=585013 RepID=A0ABR3EY98_9AGAR
MQYWFSEEWAVLSLALNKTVHPDARYLLIQKRNELLCLCCRWQADLGNMQASGGIPAWGPSAEELREAWLDMNGQFLYNKEHARGMDGYRADAEGPEDEDEEVACDEEDGVADCDEEDGVAECDGDVHNTVIAFDTVEERNSDSDDSEDDGLENIAITPNGS